MKILNYLLRPYIVIRELQKENKNMKAEILELKEENDSLWDMLDEIKKADEEAMTYQSLLGTQAIGDA
tara:strand:+ start:798 stop:1001 length:204 start_codon:yes stop_codon:yes gene_type:complete